MTFEACLLETVKTPELYEQFCRLKGFKKPTAPIERIVDEATGHEKEIVRQYAQFVFEYVYLPVFVWPVGKGA